MRREWIRRLFAVPLAAVALYLAWNGERIAPVAALAAAGTLLAWRGRSAELAGLDPRRMLALVENLGEGVLYVDAEGRTRLANPAARRLVPQAAVPRELLARARSGPLPPVTVEQLVGDRLVVSTYVTLHARGRFEGLLWLLRDARRPPEDPQRAKLAELGLLAAGIVHELSNPLSSISAVTQLARRRGIWGDHDLDLVHSQVDRLTRLVRELKDFCRPSSRRRGPVDVNRAIEDALRLAQLDRRWKLHRMELRFAEPAPHVVACPEQIQQVFLNLLLNAIDAMEESGTITIESTVQDDIVSVGFADTGPGIPPDVRARLFEPFFTTKPPGQGTGLGLSISSAIVADHGGSIEVGSRPGQGAVFTVRLPAEKSHVGTNSDR